MLEYRTAGFNGFSVKYSPFFDSRIAVASAANFGLVGNGRLYILNLTPNGIVEEKWFETQDTLYDVSWSEAHENQAVVAAGDGSVKLYDITVDEFPVQSWKEHNREVFSVHWNLVSKDTFCSSSWDGTIKVYSPHRPTSLLTLPTHTCTYSASYHPSNPSLLSAVSSDSLFRLFDLRTPSSAQNHLVLTIPLHSPPSGNHLPLQQQQAIPLTQPAEALTHDWNKYREHVFASGGVDRLIRTFDTRAPTPIQAPLSVMQGHDYAVRKVAWSPHLSHVLLSASYDMAVRIWDDASNSGSPVTTTHLPHPAGADGGGSDDDDDSIPRGEQQPKTKMGECTGVMNAHTEFVNGLDWCLFGAEGWCASVGWDERVLVWDVRDAMGGRGFG